MQFPLIGQDQIQEFIEMSINKSRIPHALILSGQSGSGKFEIAKYYALQILNTENQEHPDIYHIDLREQGLKYTDIIKDELIRRIDLQPVQGEHKIFIVSGAGNMPLQAQNALLKSLEEPPEYVVIILLSEEAGGLIPTIRSRAVKLSVKSLDNRQISKYLVEMGVDKKRASLCSALSQGVLKKAVIISEEEGYLEFAEEVITMFKKLARGGTPLDYFLRVKDYTDNIQEFLYIMEIILRDVLVYKGSNAEDLIALEGWSGYIKIIANSCSYEKLGKIREQIIKIHRAFEANVKGKESLELLLAIIGGNN